MDYINNLLLLCLLALSLLFAKATQHAIYFIFGKATVKTKTTLDDRLLAEAKEPIELSLFLLLIAVGIYAIPVFNPDINSLGRILRIGIIIILAFMLYKSVRAFFHWYFEEGHIKSIIKFDLSLIPLFQKTCQLVIIVVAFFLVLDSLGFNITGFVALSGVVVVILGLASQESLANIFAGLAMQFDRIYKYGDYLRLPAGEIVRLRKIGLRSSKLYDLSGKLIVISNSEFAKMKVAVVESGEENIDISIPFDCPLDIKPKYIEACVRKRISGHDGLAPGTPVKHAVTMVREGSYEARILLTLKNITYSDQITNAVNEIILSELERLKDKGGRQ